MKIIVLSALGNAVAQQCITSLFETTTSVDFDLFLVRERGFREQTLNFALSLVGTDKDVLFVGDDIEFTPGWHEALMDNYDRADILGMSMLYPGTTKVQDRGYDLVQIDDRVTLEAKDRGLSKDEIIPFGVRRCDSLCGCFMLVKKSVFHIVNEFSEDGRNRWGEFIFTSLARKHGASVAVIDHFLYHGGKSTKSNIDKALSSISYQAERGIWESIVNKYIDKSFIAQSYSCEISESLANILSEAEDILLYGAGTVSEHLLKHLDGKRVTICSGLPEEQGVLFHGYSVENYEKALVKSYDLIVMTPLYVGRELYERYVVPRLQDEADIRAIAITMQIEKDRYIYDGQDFLTRISSNHSLLRNLWAVILCGGRGSRLGHITESIPKPLVKVHDKPILWYTFLALYKHGFRHFIFPTGYKGGMIEEFITQEFGEHECEIHCIDTGVDSPISMRLQKIAKLIPENTDFFLLNGDTLFNFDIVSMYQLHRRKNALATLSSVEIHSMYGIIIEENGEISDFARDKKVYYLSLDHMDNTRGYVNAGLVWLNKDVLQLIDLETCGNFEQELYPKIIRMGRASHYRIDGNWFAIDTEKDLDIINLKVETQQEIGDIVKEVKKNLSSRYSYRTRYFSDVNELKEKILNKTIIPHQVEMQPGPERGSLCWLRCPYCYGNTAQDTGERLPLKRYLEIMKQIAEGGVNKVVFAGYTTDPLNYDYIEDLLQVALEYNQIFGFHTKALKISDRFIEQVSMPSIAPMSYFSVSVDAGNNETYNKVHGIPGSKAKLYDRVCENIRRIAEARAKTDAPLDISATYLINSLNGSTEEVVKAIQNLRNAGADLIRFSFPQIPRGYTLAADDPYISDREEVRGYIDRLYPIIEKENSDRCQILILDLDAQYNTYQQLRTLPCFARFVFPSIGFDGWLAHCSESSAPHFRELALGNLNKRDFWDIFYDYDVENFMKHVNNASEKMNVLSCKCDRKEHVVNNGIRESGVFNDVP